MKSQLIHAAIRQKFVSDLALWTAFGDRLANTRLPAGEPRPYAVLKVQCTNVELYSGGAISDYLVTISFYTTQGYAGFEIQEAIDNVISLMSNFTLDGAKTIYCLPQNGDDGIADETDVGSDVLIGSFTWNLKLSEGNRT